MEPQKNIRANRSGFMDLKMTDSQTIVVCSKAGWVKPEWIIRLTSCSRSSSLNKNGIPSGHNGGFSEGFSRQEMCRSGLPWSSSAEQPQSSLLFSLPSTSFGWLCLAPGQFGLVQGCSLESHKVSREGGTADIFHFLLQHVAFWWAVSSLCWRISSMTSFGR